VRVRVVLVGHYELPSDETARIDIYGTSDIRECIEIDMENDPAATLLDGGFEIESVS
jgi:hypothetical protein